MSVPVDFMALTNELTQKQAQKKVDFNELIANQEKAGAATVNQADLGEPGLDGFWKRMRIAGGDTFEEKQAIFTKMFPDGELVRVDESVTQPNVPGGILFRRNKAEPFAYLNEPGFQKEDIADALGGDIGAIAGEIVGLTPWGRGAKAVKAGAEIAPQIPSLTRQMLGAGTGAAVGDAAQQGVQTTMGEQRQTGAEIAGQAGGKGVVSAAFVPVASGFMKGLNVIRGAGVLDTTVSGREAMQAADRLGLPALTPGQATDYPIIQLMEKQAAATLPAFKRYYQSQNQAAAAGLRDRIDRSALANLRTDLDRALTNMEDSLISTVRGTRDVPASRAGKTVQAGVEKYRVESGAMVDEAYRIAREIAEPEFDLSRMMPTLEEVWKGVTGIARSGDQVTVNKIPAQVQDLVRRIATLDPKLVAREGADAPMDVLKALRQEAWELSRIPADQASVGVQRWARKLYRGLNDVMRNPTNKNPDMIAAWRAADGAAAKRFDTLEKAALVRTAASEEPAKLAARYTAPGEVDNLRLLRSTIPSKNYARLQEHFKTNLVNGIEQDPGKVLRTLDSFDKETLDMLLTPAEQKAFRQVGTKLADLEKSGVRQALDMQSTNNALVRDLIVRKDTAGVQELRNLVKGDKGARESMRAGVMDYAMKRLFEAGREGPDMTTRAVKDTIRELQESGAIRLLANQDVAFLRDFAKVAPRLMRAADAGTSIQAAEAASGLTLLSMSALVRVLRNNAVAKFYLAPEGRAFLMGTGRKEPLSPVRLQQFASGLGLAVTDTTEPMREDDQNAP